MKLKELIRKLTPECFEQGEEFDKEAFASLIDGLQKQASESWVIVVWPVLLGLAFLLQQGVGGVIGNGLSVVIIFMAPTIIYTVTRKTNKQLKSAYSTLGIRQKDVNAALQKLKKKTNYTSS